MSEARTCFEARHPLHMPLVVVVGPTASGKSSLAQTLAERMNASVLSADSMQVYEGMDIGTATIPKSMRTVPYYGLDISRPDVPYSAALFQSYGRGVIEALDDEPSRCVICGGTGLYIRALVDDYSFPHGNQTDNPVRQQWTDYMQDHGAQALWDRLNSEDAPSAALIHPNNSRRVIRAFELLAEGTTYATVHAGFDTMRQWYPATYIGLTVDPDVLRARIDARVDAMMDQGLVEEVEHLLQQGFRTALTAQQAIGYKEIVQALDGAVSMDEAVYAIKLATRRYAKRQRTWFRKDKRITWIDADSEDDAALADKAMHIVATMDTAYKNRS